MQPEVPSPQSTSPLFAPNPDASAPIMPQSSTPSVPTAPPPPSPRIPGFQPPQHEGPTHNNRSTLLICIGLIVLTGIFYTTFSFIGSRQNKIQTQTPTPLSDELLPTIILTDEPARPASSSAIGTQSANITRAPDPSTITSSSVALLSPPAGTTLNTFAHQSPAYSSRLPEPQNCPSNGCQIKSPITQSGYEATLIDSRGSPIGGKSTPGNWTVQFASVKDGTIQPSNTDWYMFGGSFFQKLQQIPIGRSVTIVNSTDRKSYIFTREPDRSIAGAFASIYNSSYTLRGGKETKYALFHSGTHTFMVAVEWLAAQNDYIFDTITSSFTLIK
jgi:hypothetical protein